MMEMRTLFICLVLIMSSSVSVGQITTSELFVEPGINGMNLTGDLSAQQSTIKAKRINLSDNNNTIYAEGFGFALGTNRGDIFRHSWTEELGDFIEINNRQATGHGVVDRVDYFFRISGSNGFQFAPKDIEAMRITGNGFVGIGTTEPSEKLHVNGKILSNKIEASQARFNGHLEFKKIYDPGGNFEQEGYKVYQVFGDGNGNAEANIQFYRNTSGGGAQSSSEIRFSTTGSSWNGANKPLSTKMVITGNGKVGIGTTNPSERLHVNGKIHATGHTGWADFVFANDYRLPSLFEVEEFIKKEGHLKDIPAEEEVISQGYSLGDMDAKLLQKIEELTLYLIEQNKRIEKLEKANKELQKLVSG